MIELGDVIEYKKEFITISDSEEYKRCRVQTNAKGVVLRDMVKGFQIKTKKQQVCRPGDFIVAEIDAKVGGYGFIPPDLDGAIVSSHYFLFDIKTQKLNPNFLAFFIKTDSFFSQINAQGSTNYAAIRPQQVLSIQIPLPPIEKQNQLVKKLQNISLNYSTLEKELQTQAKLISQLRQAILQEAVQGKLVPQDPNDEPASELLQRIKAEKERLIVEGKIKKQKPLPPIAEEEIPYELPSGWVFERMDGLFRFIDYRGKTPAKVEEGIRLITAKNVRMGYRKKNPAEFVSAETYREWMTRGFPEIDDLLFTTEAPMGNVCLVDLEECFALAQRIICLHPFESKMSKYLMYSIMSWPVQSSISRLATGMTATGIKAAKLKFVSIPIPPIQEQKRIVAKVDKLMQLCDALEQRLQQSKQEAERLLQAVLQEAFSNRSSKSN